jgi:hypothetical protein
MYSFSSHRFHLSRRKDVTPTTRKPFVPLHMPYTAMHHCSRSDRTGIPIPDRLMPFCPPGHAQTDLGSLLFGNLVLSALYLNKRGTRQSDLAHCSFRKGAGAEIQLPGKDSPRLFSLLFTLDVCCCLIAPDTHQAKHTDSNRSCAPKSNHSFDRCCTGRTQQPWRLHVPVQSGGMPCDLPIGP